MSGAAAGDTPPLHILSSKTFSGGMSGLMLASRSGNCLACENLISFGCPLDTQDSCGYTALMYACRDGHLSIVRILLDSGADATLSTRFGYNALFSASVNGFADIVSLLCSYMNPNVTDVDGMTPIACACMNNHSETVSVLLDHGADITTRDAQNRTPIMIAIDSNSLSVVELLLQRGIYLEYSTASWKCGVLYLAAVRHSYHLVDQLVSSVFYIEEFVRDLVSHPNLAAESVVEEHLFAAMRSYRVDSATVNALLVRKVKSCVMSLVEKYMGSKVRVNLSGLIETCVWCLRIVKRSRGSDPLQDLEFFWAFVERVVHACSVHEMDEVCLVPKSLVQIKLLFSFIELYCLGLSSVRSGFAGKGKSFESSPRLLEFFTSNQCFITWGFGDLVTCRQLVSDYSSIYRHMIYFIRSYVQFKH